MPQLENLDVIEKRLWSAADNLRANSNYASNEYFLPVMGLIFLRHAYSRYLAVRDDVVSSLPKRGGQTRTLTKAWVIFFLAIVAVSLVLYAFASFDAWAIFANVLTPIATAVMFGGEHLLRYRLHPEFERATAAEAVRAYMSGPKAPPAAP